MDLAAGARRRTVAAAVLVALAVGTAASGCAQVWLRSAEVSVDEVAV